MLTEQSAGIAAEAYGHYDKRPALLVVTSGPGVTNAITPVAAAWTNSTPLIVISGQARSRDVTASRDSDCRQIGNQHLRTRSIVKDIVKVFFEPVSVTSLNSKMYEVTMKSMEGRGGPVWISLPNDIQKSPIEEFEEKQSLTNDLKVVDDSTNVGVKTLVDRIIAEFNASKRPVIFIGNGARHELSREHISVISERFDAAVLTTWPALDLVSSENPRFCGRPGTIPSSWGANFVQQNCDFMLIIGARLDLAQVGYQPDNFATQATKLRIEIDELEHFRIPQSSGIENFSFNSRDVLLELSKKSEGISLSKTDWWKEIHRYQSYPKAGENQPEFSGLDTYDVVTLLSKVSPPNVVLGSSGTCVEMALQAWQSAPGQRFLNSGGLGSMGFALAAAFGVSKKIDREVLVIESDGSIAMNLQDFYSCLESPHIFRIVLLNSRGYKSIELSQKRQGHSIHGTSVEFGVPLPDYSSFIPAIGIKYKSVSRVEELRDSISWLFSQNQTCFLDVMVSHDQEATPRLISKPDISGQMRTADFEDLWPNKE